jgi:hypothetical protein
MTDREMLQSLVDTGTKMRSAQKGFFTSKEVEVRREFLIKSKQLEKEFDNALASFGKSIKEGDLFCNQ